MNQGTMGWLATISLVVGCIYVACAMEMIVCNIIKQWLRGKSKQIREEAYQFWDDMQKASKNEWDELIDLKIDQYQRFVTKLTEEGDIHDGSNL